MEGNERPPQEMSHLMLGIWPLILADLRDRRAKFIKIHKIKNTPSILISFKMIQKKQKNQKSGNFVFFYEFGVGWARGFRVLHVFKKCYLRVTDVTKSRKVHDFPWDDNGLLFGRRRKTHFLLFLIYKICNAILHWLHCWKNMKKQ